MHLSGVSDPLGNVLTGEQTEANARASQDRGAGGDEAVEGGRGGVAPRVVAWWVRSCLCVFIVANCPVCQRLSYPLVPFPLPSQITPRLIGGLTKTFSLPLSSPTHPFSMEGDFNLTRNKSCRGPALRFPDVLNLIL